MSEYTIDQGLGVRARMDLLAEVYAPSTRRLLDELGVAPGATCLDLGCGGGHVAIELGRCVGPTGHVLGIDVDAELLDVARAAADEQGLTHVVFRAATVEQLAETGFDVAWARMLLMHLRDPAEAVRSMAAAVRSGGVVALEDLDFSGCFAFPPCPANERRVAWYRETVRRRGGDIDLGPRLPALLAETGLIDVRVEVVQVAALHGHHKHLQEMSMVKQRTAVLTAGVTTEEDYDGTHAELLAFTLDPTTLLAGPRMIQAWGRRP